MKKLMTLAEQKHYTLISDFEKLRDEHELLKKEFEQYKKESIKWSVEDFTTLKVPGYSISNEQAQIALEDMIHKHDCNYGIDWDIVTHFFILYGDEVPTGTESWRQKQQNNGI